MGQESIGRSLSASQRSMSISDTLQDKIDLLFLRLDLNRNGFLDINEVCIQLGHNPVQGAKSLTQQIFEAIDKDQNGVIDRDEFKEFWLAVKAAGKERGE